MAISHAGSTDFASIIKKVEYSVVGIRTDIGMGTGFIVNLEGTVSTNRHVIMGASSIEVVFKDKRSYSGRVLLNDHQADISFIDVDKKDVAPLKLAPRRSIWQGNAVYAIGHPLGLDFTITSGIISAAEREINGCNYIQIDVPINSGNSGGPLIDQSGSVLGMCTMGLSNTQGLNFAVPAYEIKRRLKTLKEIMDGGKEFAVCPECTYKNQTTSKYCANCGANIESISRIGHIETPKHKASPSKKPSKIPVVIMSCTFCGYDNKEERRYCPNCGKRLVNEEEE